MQKSFLQSLLIKVSSFFAVIFIIIGLVFFYAFYTGATTNGLIGIVLTASGVVLAVFSLIVTNLLLIKLQSEIKESAQLAHQLAQGDVAGDFSETDASETSELLISLCRIAINLQEKAAITEQIAVGNLSAEINLRSEADVLGAAFQNMLDKLRLIVQTEDERRRLQNSVLKLLDEVKEVASGDLTVKAQVTAEITGEIAGAFNLMTAELRSLIGQVKETTFQVGSSADQINDTTEQLVRGSEAQAAQKMPRFRRRSPMIR
jgi:methyl-accepting chemotaxis protein